jgi:ketosteroid isomerase-like protein
MDNIALIRNVLETEDWPLLIDHLADDVIFKVTVPDGTPISGEFRGKQAVVDHFNRLGSLLEFRQEQPLQYFGEGDRVVVLGKESFDVKESGITVGGSEYADVFDFREGLITRFLIIQDMSTVVEAYRSN